MMNCARELRYQTRQHNQETFHDYQMKIKQEDGDPEEKRTRPNEIIVISDEEDTDEEEIDEEIRKLNRHLRFSDSNSDSNYN